MPRPPRSSSRPTAHGSHCAWFFGVWPRSLTDDSPQARELLEEAAHLSAARAPLVQALSLAQAALLAAGDDDRGRASLLAERARAQVGRCELGDSPLVALVYAVSAQLRVHSGKLGRGRRRPASGAAAAEREHRSERMARGRVLRRGSASGAAPERACGGTGVARAGCDGGRPARRRASALGMARASGRRDRGGGRFERRHRLVAHCGGAACAPPPPEPSLVPRDRRAALRLAEHRQDPRPRHLPQARRLLTRRGRRAGARSRARSGRLRRPSRPAASAQAAEPRPREAAHPAPPPPRPPPPPWPGPGRPRSS